jgi:hypothetical protein
METPTNERRPTSDLMNDPRVLEHEAKRRREDVIEACQRAVECLERFAADARREVERAADLDPARLVELPGKVLRASAWGAANAASEIDTATRMAAAYLNALGRIEARKEVAR